MFRYLLLGHLFIVGVESTCVSVHCLRCSPTPDSCPSCQNTSCIVDYANVTSNCTKDFQVSVTSSSTNINEGDDVTLTCTHNLHNLNVTFGWKKDRVELQENQSQLLFQKVLKSAIGPYSCYVNSSCGSYSSSPHTVTVINNSVYVLAICGAAALVLILVMSVIMKFKLKRENEKHRERMERRAQVPPS
ncbi:carcinoembryonic antigen-related cell adhesion molecule 6-like [Solea senegalensis]|nr:carcinoembryonic antigen-related cell adhesion molecule 6-like [Solea senegalensis]